MAYYNTNPYDMMREGSQKRYAGDYLFINQGDNPFNRNLAGESRFGRLSSGAQNQIGALNRLTQQRIGQGRQQNIYDQMSQEQRLGRTQGLSSGASERLAQQNLRNQAYQTQGLLGQRDQSELAIRNQDYERKLGINKHLGQSYQDVSLLNRKRFADLLAAIVGHKAGGGVLKDLVSDIWQHDGFAPFRPTA